MRSKHWWLPVASIVALLGTVIAAACSSNSEDRGTRIGVVATDFAFNPAEIRVKVQQRYEIQLQNDAQLLHDWTIDTIPATDVDVGSSDSHDMSGMNGMSGMGTMGNAVAGGSPQLHIAADRGKTATLSFVPTQPGEYLFYCTVSGHRAAGMQGKFIVDP